VEQNDRAKSLALSWTGLHKMKTPARHFDEAADGRVPRLDAPGEHEGEKRTGRK
jgi:hypothetical protein